MLPKLPEVGNSETTHICGTKQRISTQIILSSRLAKIAELFRLVIQKL